METIPDTSTEADKVTNSPATEQPVEKLDPIAEERKKYTTRGTSGLVNIGNTCYMNSALQCLVATDQLVAYFRGTGGDAQAEYKCDLKRGVSRMIIEEEKRREKKRALKNCTSDDERKKLEKELEKKYSETKHTVNIKKVRKRFKGSLTYRFRNIVCVMWGHNRKVKPVAFKEKLGEASQEFAGWSQNDSQECLSLILDTIHEETKSNVSLLIKPLDHDTEVFRDTKKKFSSLPGKKAQAEYLRYKNTYLKECATVEALEFWESYINKNHSVIEDIFTGLFFGTIKCEGCGGASFKFEPFKIINLHIPSNVPYNAPDPTLQDCLKNYFGCGEKLVGDCQYSCDYCECKTNAVKSTQLWHCPHRLIIQFKRFSNVHYKNNQKINFPIEGLDMSEYVTEYVGGEHIYDLYAISYHSGSLKGGHYTAYTKNPINKMWYYYDDSHVLHIPDDKLEARLVTSGAYVLLYQKREKFEHVRAEELSDDSSCDMSDSDSD